MSRSGSSTLISLFYFVLIADLPVKMMWRRRHFLRQRGSRESDVALSHSPFFCFVLSFLFLFCCFHFCFVIFVFLFFVVFPLIQIRERRGALLFALNEESAAKVIAANSSDGSTKILLNSTYLRRRRAVIFDHEARIRERRGALLFAVDEESTAKVNRRRFLNLPFS